MGLPARKALAGGLDILGEVHLSQLLNEAGVPVTVILGANDALVPASVQDTLASHEFVQAVHIIQDAGHIPFLSHLDEFSSLLKKSL